MTICLQYMHWPLLYMVFSLSCTCFSMASVRVVFPETFNNGSTLLKHKLALFGRPKYGGKLIAQLVASPLTNELACRNYNATKFHHMLKHVLQTPKAQFILLIKRGECHFVEKVRHAQAVSAVAVIIYDKFQNSNFLPLLADDGTGGDVHIPSTIISNEAGLKLIKTLKKTKVIISLDWSIPHPDNRVEWSLWRSSRNRHLHTFLQHFRKVVKALSLHAQFTPHYEVHSGTTWGCNTAATKDIKSCKKLCLYDGQVCAFDPERNDHVGLDGVDVLREDERQLCIFEYTNSTNATLQKRLLFWDYIILFNRACSVRNATATHFNRQCSHIVQKKLKIPTDIIDKCVKKKGLNLLKNEVKLKQKLSIFSVPRLTVNNAKHYGDISCPFPIELGTCSPLSMICSGFEDGTAPKACSNSFWSTQCFLPKKLDECNICLNPVTEKHKWSKSCRGCDGKPNSGKKHDICGVCGGTGSFDQCGECLQANHPNRDKSCQDCLGIANGQAKIDPCGLCQGHGSFDACGLCLDQDDPRRQNFACKVIDDPDTVRVEASLSGLRRKSFVGQVVSNFKKAFGQLVGIDEKEISIKSVSERSNEKLNVFFFITAPDISRRNQIYKVLNKDGTSIELGVRLKSLSKNLEQFSGIKIESTGIDSTNTKNKSSSNDHKWTGGAVFVLVLVCLMCAFSIGYYVMWEKEKKIRGDVRQMFAKYAPLVAVDDEINDSDFAI